MLDTSIMRRQTRSLHSIAVKKIPDPYYPGDPGGISLSAAGASDLCCGETGDLRSKGLQCSKLLREFLF